MTEPRKRRLRNFLLDPRFQLKYASLIALTGGLVFGVMGGLFYTQVRVSSALAVLDSAVGLPAAPLRTPKAPERGVAAPSGVVIEAEVIEPVDVPSAEPEAELAAERAAEDDFDDGFEAELRARMAQEDGRLVWKLVISWLVLVVLLFALGILATHRIVGPLYVVDRNLARLMAGEPVRPRPLRRGDEFQALFDRVAALGLRWQTARSEEKMVIEGALDALQARIEGAGDSPVPPATVAVWASDALAPLVALAEEKGRVHPDSGQYQPALVPSQDQK